MAQSTQRPTLQLEMQLLPPAGRARRRDPETSQEAARRCSASAIQHAILWALHGDLSAGATTEEISRYLDLSLVSVSPRMKPLSQRNLVRDSGDRRKNESGRSAIVWKAVFPV